ncbi:unnamed protein product [Calypogeia fissa]
MRHKLCAKSIHTTLVGYDETSKAYRCHDPTKRKILISRDVIFNENAKLSDWSSTAPSLLPNTQSIATDMQLHIHRTSECQGEISNSTATTRTGGVPEQECEQPPAPVEGEADLQESIMDNSAGNNAEDLTPEELEEASSAPIDNIAERSTLPIRRPQRSRALPIKLREDFVMTIQPDNPDICVVETTDDVDAKITHAEAMGYLSKVDLSSKARTQSYEDSPQGQTCSTGTRTKAWN